MSPPNWKSILLSSPLAIIGLGLIIIAHAFLLPLTLLALFAAASANKPGAPSPLVQSFPTFVFACAVANTGFILVGAARQKLMPGTRLASLPLLVTCAATMALGALSAYLTGWPHWLLAVVCFVFPAAVFASLLQRPATANTNLPDPPLT